jgi:hypothetical protein
MQRTVPSSAHAPADAHAHPTGWRRYIYSTMGATTLEWTLTSPPPFHQFETPPLIK